MAFDMQENNKVGFDMTKVKVGDKLVQRGGTVVELDRVRTDDFLAVYKYVLSDGSSITENGFYWESEELHHLDIIGFAAENQQTNCTFTETQAVELLLSLGYTLKKGV